MDTRSAVVYPSPPSAEPFLPEGAWTEENETLTPAYRELAMVADRLEEHKVALADAEAREAKLSSDLASTRASLERYKSRKVIRLLDGLGRNRQ